MDSDRGRRRPLVIAPGGSTARPLAGCGHPCLLTPLFPAKAGIQAFSDGPGLFDKTPGSPLSRGKAGGADLAKRQFCERAMADEIKGKGYVVGALEASA